MPAANDERELKLLVPGDFQLPSLTGPDTGIVAVSDIEPQDLTATYFDTPDLRLLDLGITLRYRSGEGTGIIWTLKLPAESDETLRHELVFPAANGVNGQPPAEVTNLLFGVLSGAHLAPVAEIKTRRLRSRLVSDSGDEVAELVDDRVSVLDGNHIRDSFREIEIESLGAGKKDLKRIAKVIERAGAQPDQRAKVSRALEALRNPDPEVVAPAEVGPSDPATAAVRPAFAAALRQLLLRDPHARLGGVEGVHRMRVAARRLRSVFRTFAPLLDEGKTAAVVDEVRWLGVVLGDVRDLDVIEENIRAEAGGDPALGPLYQTLSARMTAARSVLIEALSSPRYTALLSSIDTFIADDSLVIPESPGPCKTALPELVERARGKLHKAARQLEDTTPEVEFHEARKLAKRARYAADAVAPFVTPKEAQRLKTFATTMTTVQNVLGEHQDAAVARDTLLGIAAQHPQNGNLNLHIGRLVERAELKRDERRRAFLKLSARLEKGKNARWSKV